MDTNPNTEAETKTAEEKAVETQTSNQETKQPETGKKLREVFEGKLSEKDQEIAKLREEMQSLKTNVEGRHVSNLYKEHGVEFEEQKEVLKEYQSNTGKSLDEILSNPIIKKELSSIAGRKKAEAEQAQGGGKQGSLDYYIRTGKRPSDPETRRQLREWHKQKEKEARNGRS